MKKTNTGETVVLDYPIELADGQLTELHMRRPTVGDHLEAEKHDGRELSSERVLFARLCGIKAEEITLVDMADYKRLQGVYTGFLAPRKKE